LSKVFTFPRLNSTIIVPVMFEFVPLGFL